MSPKLTAWLEGPARSWIVSQAYALWGAIVCAEGIGYALGPAHGGYNDWPSLVTFNSHAWFGVALAFFFGIGPYVRAKQGADRIASTVPLAGGGSAIMQPNVAPPSPATATITLGPVTKP